MNKEKHILIPLIRMYTHNIVRDFEIRLNKLMSKDKVLEELSLMYQNAKDKWLKKQILREYAYIMTLSEKEIKECLHRD